MVRLTKIGILSYGYIAAVISAIISVNVNKKVYQLLI